MPNNRPEKLDPAPLAEIRALSTQIGEHSAIVQALTAQRSLVLVRALARAGVSPEDMDAVQLQPDGALVYPPLPLPPEVAAALKAEREIERGATTPNPLTAPLSRDGSPS